jgi:hypothetical protein
MKNSLPPIVRWEDPPPAAKRSKQRTVSIQRIVGYLQAHPGKWALVMETYNNIYAVRLKRNGCEATSRETDGAVRIYARWPDA